MAKVKKLTLSSTDKQVSGVCGGMAEYFDIDSGLLRLGWALFVLVTGVFPGLVLYAIAATVLPKEGK